MPYLCLIPVTIWKVRPTTPPQPTITLAELAISKVRAATEREPADRRLLSDALKDAAALGVAERLPAMVAGRRRLAEVQEGEMARQVIGLVMAYACIRACACTGDYLGDGICVYMCMCMHR